MKNYTTIIISILLLSISYSVHAGTPSVYTSPISITKNPGETFDLSVVVDARGEKTCVSKGSINLNQLTCKSVSMGSGISSLVEPNCNNLNFNLGIQRCTTGQKKLFNIRVQMDEGATNPSAKLMGVNVIGVGVPLGFVTFDSAIISKLAQPIIDLIQQIEDADPGSDLEKFLKDKFKKQIDSINDAVELINWLKEVDPGSELESIVMERLNKVINPIKDAKQIIDYLNQVDAGSLAEGILYDQLKDIIDPINDVKTILGWLKRTDLKAETKRILNDKVKSLLGPVDDAKQIIDYLKDVDPGSELANFLNDKLNSLIESGENIVDNVVGAVEDVKDTATGAVELIKKIPEFIQGIVDFFKSIFSF